MLAPNAKLRRAVTESAGPAGVTLQLLQEAREKMGLPEPEATAASAGAADDGSEPRSRVGRVASRCWALLLARIFECLPLSCPNCGEPMRIVAFVLDGPQVERILAHIGESTTPPAVSPARSPPQQELDFDQVAGADEWPEMDQTMAAGSDTWE